MLFRRRPKPDPDSLVHEHWSSSFRWYQKRRLPGERTRTYESRTRGGRFELAVKKSDCFAWILSPFRARDLMLEGRFGFAETNGHSACGLVLRYINEENFYYFLVSNRGFFRFDVVFNGNPIHLIEWTEAPEFSPKELELRAIAHGSSFSFFLDDEWIAEMDDETIPEGRWGPAAQNYSEREKAEARLYELTLESRPLAVERAYYRWARYMPARREHRLRLARTLAATGRPAEALIQLNRVLRDGWGGAEDHLLRARVCRSLRLYEEALASTERSLALEPERPESAVEKAEVLLLQGRFLEAREHLEALIELRGEEAHLHALLGNAEYSLGRFQEARSAFERAWRLNPQDPIPLVNRARSEERLGLPEALAGYLEAAGELFRREIYDELSLVLARGSALAEPGGSEHRQLQALEAKMLWHEGKRAQAERLLAQLAEAGHPDSAVFFLYGLMLADGGRRREAEEMFGRAVELEPDYPPYWFRLAESRFLRGEAPGEALEKAAALDPADPWINNLRGQVELQAGRVEEAVALFRSALAAAPEEPDIYRNLAGALLQAGRAQEAVELLEKGIRRCGEEAALFDQRGTCRAAAGDLPGAVADYESALRLAPENNETMKNCLAACLEVDMIMRAEELATRLLDRESSAEVYNLTGNLAAIKGEHRRAELAYGEALALEPDNREVRLNLASLHLEQGRHLEAKKLVEEVLAACPDSSRALELQGRLRQRFEQRLVCDGCGREWWTPREIPPQPTFQVRGEPPAEAPAGRCGNCGRLYCIRCAEEHVQDRRLVCAQCREPLKLSDDTLRYLLLTYL